MKIKISFGDKKIYCEVKESNCKDKPCLSPHKYIHQNTTIDGTMCTHQDDFYSCSYRNYHGCPDIYVQSTSKKVKE